MGSPGFLNTGGEISSKRGVNTLLDYFGFRTDSSPGSKALVNGEKLWPGGIVQEYKRAA